MKIRDNIDNTFSITILRKRLLAIIIAVTFLFCLILGRLFYIQIIWGDSLQEKAIDQWTREIPVVASRGKIVDRNGVVLTDNNDTYTVFVRKKAISDLDRTATHLADVLEISKEYVLNRLTTTFSSEITLKKQVCKEKIDKLLNLSLSGVYYSRDNSRVYPYGDFLTSILGFTSTDGKGQSGLELYYDKYLSGINGEILYETDIVGVEIDGGKASYIPATNGLNLKLTIDYEIQQLCESAMKNAMIMHSAKSAKILVLNPQTGEILAMSTKPSFDLNSPPRDDLNLLNALTRNGLISDMYEPGSTFKIITTAANVEEYLKGNSNAYSLNHIFNSSRYRYIDGQKVKCWSNHNNGKHSNLNIEGALENSCNPIFVDIAMSLGKDIMYDYIEKFNFGKTTGIDFNGESAGMVLPKSVLQNVDLARVAFGQTIAVSGLQLALAVGAIANGGEYYEPYLLKEVYSQDNKLVEIINPKMNNRVVSKKTSSIINELLEKAVENGSGKHAYIQGYRVAGKTGTAQKYENGIIAQGKYVSSFIGYFPANNPQYLTLIIIDEPQGEYYGSLVAAPYAKTVFEGIIKCKNIKAVV